MAPTGRRKDLIDQDAGVIERVRKLEVLGNPRTLVPKMWKPHHTVYDIIAQHITLLGAWRNNQDWQYDWNLSGVPPFASVAARHCHELLLTEGFGGDPEVGGSFMSNKYEWTNFLWLMHAIPSPFWINELSFSAGTEDTGPLANHLTAWQVPYHHPMNKVLIFSGLPERGGPWHWAETGAGWYGFSRFPGISLTDPPNPELQEIWDNGGHGAWSTGIPEADCGIVRRNNNYGFSASDCGGPNDPPYSAYLQPGIPAEFDAGYDPCPNAPPGVVFQGGSVIRIATWLPFNDLCLWGPPLPRSNEGGAGGGGEDELLFPYPGMSFLSAQAEAWLGVYPGVAAFYERAIPAALAKLQTVEYKHWEPFSLAIPWSGNLEATRVQDRVMLRGTITWDSDGVIDEPWIGAIQNDGLGSPTWFSGLDSARLLVRTEGAVADYGFTHVIFDLFPSPLGEWCRVVWSPAHPEHQNNYHGPFTMHFDGLSFPVRPGS